MKRACAALASAAVLIALLPGTMSAAKPTRYSDHAVDVFCESPVDGGYASVGLNTSSAFGDGASADLWLDPAVAFQDPPTMTGSTSTVDRTESPTEVVLTATFPVADADGVGLGDATLTATMTPVGDPEVIGPTPGKTNHHSSTHGTSQQLAGTISLTVPGHELSLTGCSGSITDLDVFEMNPHSFVSSAKGIIVDCFWQESDDSSASFFAVQDDTGLFLDAGLTTSDFELFSSGQATGALSATAVAATVGLVDSETGQPHTAIASAAFTGIGSPVTSTLISQSNRTRTTQQALAAHGTLSFDTGQSFVMDTASCKASTFDRHSQGNTASGPKPGPAPANDAPDGAVRLRTTSKPNLLTGGSAVDAEVPNVTCPEGPFDAMGHTVWYTVIGTGRPITIDTSGSDFDTVAAAYQPDGGGLTEIACDDDVDFVPIGGSYQAVVTFDTEPGVEYFVQVGGIENPFTGEVESGRLRLTVR